MNNKDLVDTLRGAVSGAQAAAANLDLDIMEFGAFGKGAIKKFKVSPDSAIQMAMQLAFYRDQKKFGLTCVGPAPTGGLGLVFGRQV